MNLQKYFVLHVDTLVIHYFSVGRDSVHHLTLALSARRAQTCQPLPNRGNCSIYYYSQNFL